jgi:hypothetical protein
MFPSPDYSGGTVMITRAVGYQPIWTPPALGSVDVGMLMVQFAVVSLIVGGLAWMLGKR